MIKSPGGKNVFAEQKRRRPEGNFTRPLPIKKAHLAQHTRAGQAARINVSRVLQRNDAAQTQKDHPPPSRGPPLPPNQ